MKDIMGALGDPGVCLIFRQENGTARQLHDPERIFKYGTPGLPDLWGMARGGAWFGIECKTGDAVQNKKQKDFQAACERIGVAYRVCRSVEDALQFVNGLVR